MPDVNNITFGQNPDIAEDALVEAAKILRKHLNPFIQYHELGSQLAPVDNVPKPVASTEVEELRRKLEMPIAAMELSVRASNCLEATKISSVAELVRIAEPQLLQLRSFGKTSLIEVKRKLVDMGLSLGMNVDEIINPVPANMT